MYNLHPPGKRNISSPNYLNQELDYSEIKIYFITINNEYSGVY